MLKSDLILRSPTRVGILLAATLAWTACAKGAEEAEGPPETPNVPFKIEPLTDAELMGVPREQVLLTLPWSEQTVSRDPAPVAARATLKSVEVAEGPAFDRTVFEFSADTDFPGYRVVWDDTTNARCGEEKPATVGTGRTLLIRFQPAWARVQKGKTEAKTIAQAFRSPRLPSVATARQVCDDADKVVWALGANDSTVFRVVELHTPPRLVVDVAHPGVRPGSAAATADTASPAPR